MQVRTGRVSAVSYLRDLITHAHALADGHRIAVVVPVSGDRTIVVPNPYPQAEPCAGLALITVPSAAATIGAPTELAMSTPSCFAPPRVPKFEVTSPLLGATADTARDGAEPPGTLPRCGAASGAAVSGTEGASGTDESPAVVPATGSWPPLRSPSCGNDGSRASTWSDAAIRRARSGSRLDKGAKHDIDCVGASETQRAMASIDASCRSRQWAGRVHDDPVAPGGRKRR